RAERCRDRGGDDRPAGRRHAVLEVGHRGRHLLRAADGGTRNALAAAPRRPWQHGPARRSRARPSAGGRLVRVGALRCADQPRAGRPRAMRRLRVARPAAVKEAALRPNRTIVVAALGTSQTLAWASSYYLPAVLGAAIAAGLGMPTGVFFAVFSAALLLQAIFGPYL